MKDLLWQPTEAVIRSSNIWRFMQRHGLKTYEQLIARSATDLERRTRGEAPIAPDRLSLKN